MRWIITNIAGSNIGIAVGTSIAVGIYYQISRALSFENCSGLPCDSRDFPTMVLAGVIGGIIGGCIGYISFQKMNRFPIARQYIIRYALLGAFIWPVDAVIAIICYFLILFLVPRLDVDPRLTNVVVWGYIIAAFVPMPGIVLGLLLALVRRIPRNVEWMPNTEQRANSR